MSLLSDFALVLHSDDNIAIAKQEIVAETKLTLVNGELLSVRENIPIAHKFALRAIGLNEPVLRYGSRIGIATRPIAPGDWVHTHNVDVGKIDRAYSYTVVPTPPLQPA
jgi:altronate hydrolase